jgi:hypothetical protein
VDFRNPLYINQKARRISASAIGRARIFSAELINLVSNRLSWRLK